jgi:KAP family P-loop domain
MKGTELSFILRDIYMQFDRAITATHQDKFERDKFAKHIAKLLVLQPDSPSFTLALEGSWGIGKTSIINLVKGILSEGSDPDTILVEFNPWLIGNLDSIVEGFLIQFAASIGKTPNNDVARKASQRLIKFAQFLSPIKLIPGVEPWGSILEKTLGTVGNSVQAASNLSKYDLNERKADLQQAISDLDTPIVVIIDDIDRLPPEETRIIFQLVKAICDFKRVSYLLAYDPGPVAKALSYDDTYDGRAYLEKIVQVAYPVPRVGYWHLKQFLNGHINSMLERLGVELLPDERSLFEEALNRTGAVRSLATPRDVIRLVNKLLLSVSATRGEVNFADVFLFEVLELKFPIVAQKIRRSPDEFAEGSYEDPYALTQTIYAGMGDRDQREQAKKEFLSEVLSPYEGNKKDVKSIVGFLFPEAVGSMVGDRNAVANNRISVISALNTLLQSGVSRFNISNEVCRSFLATKEGREQNLMDFLGSGNINGWFGRSADFFNEGIDDPEDLITQVLKISSVAYEEQEEDIVDEAGVFIQKLIKALPVERREPLVRMLVSDKDHIAVAENVILGLLQGEKMWASGVYYEPKVATQPLGRDETFAQEALVGLKDLWLKTVGAVSEGDPDSILNGPQPLSVLFRWGQLEDNSYSAVKAYVNKLTETEDGLRKFVRVFPIHHEHSGIEKFVYDIPTMLERLESVKDEPNVESIIDSLSKVTGSP